MTKEQKKRTNCLYRVFTPLCVITTGQWIPAGVIADLADISDKMLRWMLEQKWIETADPAEGEAVFNQALGVVDRPPCPCNQQ